MFKLLLSLVVFSILISPSTILAQSTQTLEEVQSRREEMQKRLQERQQMLKDRVASKAAGVKAKLEANKLRVCESRQEILKKRAGSLATRADRQFDVFTGIAGRVDTYYTTKLVPQGVIVEDYEELLVAIQDQKENAETLITSVTAAGEDFDCASDDPKGQLEDFNAKMRLVIEALKDYRTSIKNLIVAVRTAVSESKTATSAAGN